ncbi:MAG: DNA polymerase III PolC-type [Candidatus Anoxychlamydiales bacterium]|nr:DNA polymerase III PolC-type [Candidatus Anoxychlamydiales bacterium]
MAKRPIYYDTETTGLSSQKDRIIEIAAFDPEQNRTFEEFVNPNIPIPQESTNICNITDDMVKDAPTFDIIGKKFIEFCGTDTILIAHNNDSFDKPFLEAEFKRADLKMPDFPFIDTLKWSRKYRPDLPKHALQYLREMYNVEANAAHRALNDVIILHKVFTKMIDDLDVETVLKLLYQEKSDVVEYMPFGKHQGKKLDDVPKSYIRWLQESEAFEKPQNTNLKKSLEKLNLLSKL